MASLFSPGETGLAATVTDVAQVSPEQAAAVARPKLSQALGNQPAGGTKKTSQRGLSVAELEGRRCDGDPLWDLNAAAAVPMADMAIVQGHPILPHHHHHLSNYSSTLLVQPSSVSPAPAARVCYVHSPSAGVKSVEHQQYFMDRWGGIAGFIPLSNAGAGSQPQLPATAPQQSSTRSTIGRPVSSCASSCLHTSNRCDLCWRNTATTKPDYYICNLAAAMAAGCKVIQRVQEKVEGFMAREGEKELREIEFFPKSPNQSGGVGPDDEPEFATMESTHFPTSSGSGCAAPLDLSLRL